MAESNHLLLVHVEGRDRPEITASLMQVLVEHDCELAEIQHACLHGRMAQDFVVDLAAKGDAGDGMIRDLLVEANRLDLTVHFDMLIGDKERYRAQPKLLVITHFGNTPSLASISAVLGEEGARIQAITTSRHHEIRSIELVANVDECAARERLKQRIMAKSREFETDTAIQRMEAYRKSKRLILFDMDSTLVDMEIIDEMARQAGVYREVARVTERAMRGDFDFEESLVQRVALLKGLRIAQLEEIRDSMRLSEGIPELLRTLKWLGFKTGIVSGGFEFFAAHLKEKLGLDMVFSNRLEIKGEALTGKVLGDILDAPGKARAVNRVSCDLGIPLDQTVVVGDGANDALMLAQAGLGIAYNAKPRLDRIADAGLRRAHIGHILHLLGITEEDIHEAMTCGAP